jgi:hypothetical protein
VPQGLNESYYRESAAALGIPLKDASRPHSVPPPTSSAVVHRPRTPSPASSRSSSRSDRGRSYARSYRSDYRSDYRSHGHTPDPIHRTRGILENNFSHTRAGIGAGIVGAVVGGLVAKQASQAALRHRHKQSNNNGRPRRHSSEALPRIASTVLGAVAGALGANALTHKLEDARERNKNMLAWENRHDGQDDDSYYNGWGHQDQNYRRGRVNHDAYDYEYDNEKERRWDGGKPRRQRIEERSYQYRY